MVAGLQHDASHIKMKLLELERAVSCCDDWPPWNLLKFGQWRIMVSGTFWKRDTVIIWEDRMTPTRLACACAMLRWILRPALRHNPVRVCAVIKSFGLGLIGENKIIICRLHSALDATAGIECGCPPQGSNSHLSELHIPPPSCLALYHSDLTFC